MSQKNSFNFVWIATKIIEGREISHLKSGVRSSVWSTKNFLCQIREHVSDSKPFTYNIYGRWNKNKTIRGIRFKDKRLLSKNFDYGILELLAYISAPLWHTWSYGSRSNEMYHSHLVCSQRYDSNNLQCIYLVHKFMELVNEYQTRTN